MPKEENDLNVENLENRNEVSEGDETIEEIVENSEEETTEEEEIVNPIEIVEPTKEFVDETEGEEPERDEKSVEITEEVDGVFITKKQFAKLTEDEMIEKKIKELKMKIVFGTATQEEKEDLKLLLS